MKKSLLLPAVRTRTMKIWRMGPDESQPEQVPFDEDNDWFPHISPDGKWIVYLSFPKDLDPNDHPFCNAVYLRLIPESVGEPKNNCLYIWPIGNDQCAVVAPEQQERSICK